MLFGLRLVARLAAGALGVEGGEPFGEAAGRGGVGFGEAGALAQGVAQGGAGETAGGRREALRRLVRGERGPDAGLGLDVEGRAPGGEEGLEGDEGLCRLCVER